jgi:hypothetical protein
MRVDSLIAFAIFLLALLASRLFVAARNAQGASLPTSRDRRDAVLRQPFGWLGPVFRADLAVWRDLAVHHSGRSEFWRLSTWLLIGLGVFVALMGVPGLGHPIAPLQEADPMTIVRLVAWAVSLFWASQLVIAMRTATTRLWQLVCAGGALGPLAIALFVR